MSFWFEIDKGLPVGIIRISIRNPEFGDTHRFGRRQAAGTTEGGREFVQDLGANEVFYEATWANLDRCERRDLEFFFGDQGTQKRRYRFYMGVEDNSNLAFPIGTGQGYNTSADLNSGVLVVPTDASFGEVRLAQSEISFAATLRDRYTTSLRFRILQPCP